MADTGVLTEIVLREIQYMPPRGAFGPDLRVTTFGDISKYWL
jgi:hypothetical protein